MTVALRVSEEADVELSDGTLSLALPLLGSLIVTSAVLRLSPLVPSQPSLNWLRLSALALVYVLITAIIHAGVVWGMCRLFRDHIQHRIRALILELWPSIVWVPLLVLLDQERSVWVCLILPLLIGNVVSFVKHKVRVLNTQLEPQSQSREHGLFYIDESPTLWRTLLPFGVIVLATQAAILSLLMHHPWLAGCLFALGFAFVRWRAPLTPQADDHGRRSSLGSSMVFSLLALVLVAVALTPFLVNTGRGMRLNAVLGIRKATPLRSLAAEDTKLSTIDYSGIVLLLPLKPHHEILPPRPIKGASFAGVPTKPIVIPFDGAYWYFKQPDERPKRDAKVRRGDPLKENIRSTDRLPLLMAAHQKLLGPVKVNCCRALRVELTNADNRPGVISVEMWLRDSSTQAHSKLLLGSVVIPSSTAHSISLNRAPIKEVLTFRLPTGSAERSFDEITVLIKPAWERELAGSKVAIQNFVLVP